MTDEAAPEGYPDADLMRRIALQDEKALDIFYARYSTPVYSLLLRILRKEGEAEDLLQEIFLQIWHKAYRYQARKGDVSVWLITLARNRAIDRLRSKDYRQHGEMRGSEELEFLLDLDVEANPFQSVLRSEHRAIVRRALSSLPKNQRKVLEMAYFDGHTLPEIARKLRKPLGTVKTQSRLGMIRLRDFFKKLSDKVR